jgi:hypothetical protein
MARRRRYESERDYEYERSSRRTSYRRRERRMEERRIELVTFVALMLLFAFGLLYPGAIQANWLALIGGAILVGSAIYQTQRRWRVNPATWFGGAIMLIVGIMSMNGFPMPGGIFFPLAVFAGIIAYSAITGEL